MASVTPPERTLADTTPADTPSAPLLLLLRLSARLSASACTSTLPLPPCSALALLVRALVLAAAVVSVLAPPMATPALTPPASACARACSPAWLWRARTVTPLPVALVVPRTSAVTAGAISAVAAMKPNAPPRPNENALAVASASALETASTVMAPLLLRVLATASSPRLACTPLLDRAVTAPPLAPPRPPAADALPSATAVFLPCARTVTKSLSATPPRRSAVVLPPTMALLLDRPKPIRPEKPTPEVVPVARLAPSASTCKAPPADSRLPAPTLAVTTAAALASALAPTAASSSPPADDEAEALVSWPVAAVPLWL